MKVQKLWIAALGLACVVACVPAKQFKDLQDKFTGLQQENMNLRDSLSGQEAKTLEKAELLEKLQAEKSSLAADYADLERQKQSLQEQYNQLKSSYDALEDHSSSALKANAERNRELLAEIEAKQEKLDAEQARLEKLQADLTQRGKRIAQLEEAISAKENQMSALKDKISTALTDFEGKGLHVHRKNGKVYVSMDNKLLFKTASWTVNPKGQEALRELAKVLAQNPDINVLIEGHTDNVPYNGHSLLKDNWDLSMKRATSVVRILVQNKGVDPANLTAAGRSEYVPVASNSTADGRAKNRRIEVILTPEWNKIADLLKS